MIQEQSQNSAHSLRHLSKTQQVEQRYNTISQSPISPYRTYTNRFNRARGGSHTQTQLIDTLENDKAIQSYYNDIRSRRGNNGFLSPKTKQTTRNAIYNFAKYTDLETSTTTYSKLITFKRENPNATEIEQTLRNFSVEPPIKYHTSLSTVILGIFRTNFAPLNIRISNHFPPAEENCTEGIFLDIYQHQHQETKDMLQWTQYVPERIKAACRVPFEDIDLSRKDYAIIWIQAIRSKTRTKHPCFVPIDFAKRVIQQAKAAQRTCPFPNHENIWRRLTAFAKQEYKVRLVSNYLRKRYVDIAEQTTMPKAQAAFIMGDKTKIALEGIHLDLIYGRGLRFVEELIKNYDNSGLAKALNIEQPTTTKPITQQSKQQILAEINRLQSLLTNTQ